MYSIQGIVSDLDGVVYRGGAAIPDAVEAFRLWNRIGIPYAFVTNNSTRSAAEFAAKLQAMGVPAAAADIVTAATATAACLARRWPAGTPVFVIGEHALLDAISAAGFQLQAAQPEVVVVGFDYGLDFGKLRTAVQAVLGGAALVATNPDVLTPTDDGFEPCVGAIVAAIVAAAPMAQPIFAGKPEPDMIEDALARLGTPRSGTIMIGDQIATDIVAGRRAGLRTFLVETGVPYAPAHGIEPDRVIRSLREIELRAA